MNIDRFWLLAGWHLAGEATPEEEKELLDGLSRYPEYKLRYDVLNAFWGRSKQQDAIDVEKSFRKVKERLAIGNEEKRGKKKQSKSMIPSFLLKIAAVLVLATVIGYIALKTIPASQWNYFTWQEKNNRTGERSEIALPDGSSVWLNASSQLKFPDKFSGNTREVYLSGEAFFDVAKDVSKPFIIHLDNGDIRVLGTSFNVKAFNDEAYIETSVVTGKVAFITTAVARHDTVLLTPNYKGILAKESGRVIKQKTNTADDRAWVDGTIIFRSSSLEEVGKVLERAYGKKMLLDSPSLKYCKLTGTFQSNTLEEIMEMIATTKDYQFTMTEKEIHLNGTGCSPDSNQINNHSLK
jgi:transmembrane sensor